MNQQINWFKSILVMSMIFILSPVFASTEAQVSVDISEQVDKEVRYNPLDTGSGIWMGANEELQNLSMTGTVNITNLNTNFTISDIYVILDNTSRTTTPELLSGRNGTVTVSGDQYIFHIFELEANESSIWNYTIDETITEPPLNITPSYSDTKVLAGQNVTVNDSILNEFDGPSYTTDSCFYDISLNQTTVPVNLSGSFFDFTFVGTPINSSGNYTISNGNRTLYWSLRNGNCLNFGESEFIQYIVNTPFDIPATRNYDMLNSTLEYKVNQTISHLRFDSMRAVVSDGVTLGADKAILGPSDPLLHGSNVTWNGTGMFSIDENITLRLNDFTIWVARRDVSPIGDPNTIANDTITGTTPLNISYDLDLLVNQSNPWTSPGWLFNYTDLPTPIMYSKANFTIADDGRQLINRSITQNGEDIYIKELYLILGYWLNIEKNITSLGNDSYNVRIDVYNKGSQVTPEDSIVRIYDFVPQEFNVTTDLSQVTNASLYSISPWYDTAYSNSSVSGGGFNGDLLEWGLIPTGVDLNTSFAQGPNRNINNSWSVTFNVTGEGEYDLLDVFITGLDPEQIDGGSATRGVFVSEFVDKMKSSEGIFAAIASVMLVLGLLV